MAYPHIRVDTTRTAAQGFYRSQGRAVPQEIYTAFIAADSFDTNQQFWLQRDTGGALQRVRVDSVQPLDLPPMLASAAQTIDTGRNFQTLRIYTGDSIGTATAIEQDDTASRRWRVLFSLG